MDDKRQTVSFLPLEPAALRLGLPKTFLRQLADDGAVPYLHVGKRRLFNLEDVSRVLRLRTSLEFIATGEPAALFAEAMKSAMEAGEEIRQAMKGV